MTIKPLRFASVLLRRTFFTDRCLSLAAAISFYAILSFVPFLLLAASLLSHLFSSSDQASQDIIAFVTANLPLSTSAAIELISATVKGKTIFGIVGVIGLLWGSLSIFMELEYDMNRIWRTVELRSSWSAYVVPLLCVPVMILFLLISLALTGLISLAGKGEIPVLHLPLLELPFVGTAISFVVPIIVSTMLFAWIYYLLPSKWNHFKSAFYGALLASILWEISKLVFDYYVSHVSRFLTIYGSFTSIAIMFLWVYCSAFVVLLGAEFGALWHDTITRGKIAKASQ
ncbi:MAG: YihY/virulence factor BrkB family protein [Candidatus Zixiibacteriota bacterium]|nr:MAG: YihY/virulence factor BrkB family protein [candidate division Zixibacteria bacterium]